MIIKEADSKKGEIEKLEALLTHADARTKPLIESELRMMRAGIKGEKDSAYYIDFALKNSQNSVVLHDLRLEHNGRVAQIDHLIIHISHRFYVIESKYFSHGLNVNEYGEFQRWNDWQKKYEGMPSPIEQNKRHVAVLYDVLEDLGYKATSIESFVIVSPSARIKRSDNQYFSELLKADQLISMLDKLVVAANTTISGAVKMLSKAAFADKIDVVARKIADRHTPISIDYERKFGLRASNAPIAMPHTKNAEPSHHFHCEACGKDALNIQYGKYGYYFTCKACESNKAIKVGCGISGHKERIRKDKSTFYRECAQCGTSTVYFINQS